jgi:hypothetical protein
LFREHLQVYFAGKAIYRDLFMSRVKPKQRKAYLTRIHVFEKAFRTGKLESINY